MAYKNVGSCAGICPVSGPRCSPCPQPSTEDNRTPLTVGLRVFNYYDGIWGTVEEPPKYEGDWWKIRYDDGGSDRLNGVRLSTVDPSNRGGS
jgi:hypothetical protein